MRRLATRLLALGLLLVLAVAHWYYWYRPRARAMAPAASVLLPRGSPQELQLWIPYPHQNLGYLEREVEDPEAMLAAAFRLVGLPPPTQPRLEPFGLPPAREIRVSSNPAGEALAMEVLPYPMVRVAARLAGRLAANPWLSGGEAEVRDRSLVVGWDGAIWTAREHGSAAALAITAGSAEPAQRQPVFGLLEVPIAKPPLPAGRYRWLAEERNLLITNRGGLASSLEVATSILEDEGLVLLFLRRREGGAVEALVLFDRESGLVPGFPSAAVLAVSREGERLLPGGRLLSGLGRLPIRETAAGTLMATDRRALEQAVTLVPRWQQMASAADGRGQLEVGLWVATELAAARSRRLLGFLEGFPLTPRDEVQRWRDATLILETAAGRYRAIEAWATSEAAELRGLGHR